MFKTVLIVGLFLFAAYGVAEPLTSEPSNVYIYRVQGNPQATVSIVGMAARELYIHLDPKLGNGVREGKNIKCENVQDWYHCDFNIDPSGVAMPGSAISD